MTIVKMIESVLAEINEAEKQAETIAEAAAKQAEKIISDAEDLCRETLENARKTAKTQRLAALSEAEKKATENYVEYIRSEREIAEKLLAEKSAAADKLGEKVFGVIADGDC